MSNHNDEVIHLKWDNYGSLHRFNLRTSEWQFSKLLEKIRTIQPLFNDTLGYIDEDGDCVLFSSSLEMDELLELAKSRNEKTIRIKTIGKGKEEEVEQAKNDLKTEKEIHPNIMCDLCDKFIAGIRYKCTICDDYDLCEDCEKTGIHPEHPMLRLANPRTPKGPFEMKRRWMRGSRCGRGPMGQPSNRCPFQPSMVQEAVQNAMRKSATFPTPNADVPKANAPKEGENGPQEQKGAEFLKDVGTMLQSVLSNFGIDVDMSIEHNNKLEKVPKPDEKAPLLEKAPEMQAPPVPPRVPTAPTMPMRLPEPPMHVIHMPQPYPPNPTFPVPFGLADALYLKKAEELKAAKAPKKASKGPFQPETVKEAVQNVMKPKEMPQKEDEAQKAAQEFADQTAKDTLEEAIEAVTKDVLKKSEEVLDFAVNTVNNIKDNPQTKEEMEKIMKNAAEATQFAINQAAEMVKRNSSYMAANAENPQFRSFMASVSQWADKMAEFYPGINPQKDATVEDKVEATKVDDPKPQEAPKTEMYTDMPVLVPEKESKVDGVPLSKPPVDIMSMSNSSLATAFSIDDDIPIINKEMFYKDVIEAKDNASIGTNTTTSEKKSAETQYYSDDSDVEIITGSIPGSPIPTSHATAPDTKESSPYPQEPAFKEEDGWDLINNANYEAMCKFYEEKRKVEEARRKELEEELEQQRRVHTRMLMEKAAQKIEEEAKKSAAASAAVPKPPTVPLYPTLEKEDDCTAGIPYPTMPSSVRPHNKICFFKHPDPIVQNAVETLEVMGYDNCNGWLTRLAEKCKGDISMILDEAAKDPLHLARLD